MATSTSAIATNIGGGSRKKKKKIRIPKAKTTNPMRGPLAFTFTALSARYMVDGIMDEWVDEAVKKDHVMRGDSKWFRGLFARGVLTKRLKSGNYAGWKGRTYRVSKVGNEYHVSRIKS